MVDSDGDGTSGADEDPDGDAISIRIETEIGTDPLKSDNDGNPLDDNTERLGPTDPLPTDTDGDGLTDESEVRLGTNPQLADSNGNGIPDGQGIYTTIATSTDGTVRVELTGVGDVAKETTVRGLPESVRFERLPGQVGDPYLVTTAAPFSFATIYLPYQLMEIPSGDRTNVEIFRYDEEQMNYDALSQAGDDGEWLFRRR